MRGDFFYGKKKKGVVCGVSVPAKKACIFWDLLRVLLWSTAW